MLAEFVGWGSAAALVAGYLLGSIPFGLVITRLAGLGDIRTIGSGNIGATNVLRTGRRELAAATLLADALKGTAAVLILGMLGRHAALAAGLGAFLGHLFPVWLGFKGGKAVATYFGVLVGLSWPAAIVFAVVWLAVAFTTRFSSVSGLTASLATPPTLFLLQAWDIAWLFVLLTVILWIRHRENITRLVSGTESRIGEKK